MHLLHIITQLAIVPQTAGIHVVISGHSHKPLLEERHGVLFLNPGSAGPRRFKLPVSVAKMAVQGAIVRAELVELEVS